MGTKQAKSRTLVSSVALYAIAGISQRGMSFLLIPVYTRLIEPAQYGIFEILNALSSVLFAFLTLGLASAINKCFHRDCRTEDERRGVLLTALLIDLPFLLGGCALLAYFANPVGRLLIGSEGMERLLHLVLAGGIFFGANTLILASIRARERAAAFAVLSCLQFVLAIALNVLLVVVYRWGIEGILWGNLISNALVTPLYLFIATRFEKPVFRRGLVAPLLRFGIFLIPVMIASWVMDASDRYILRIFHDLDEVALYGVGYKFGMVLQLCVTWPFQLAWPAFSFRISNAEGHRETYAKTLSYLTLVLAFGVLGISLLTRDLLPILVGPAYAGAERVVPIVALAYALNGVQFCTAPGLHLTSRTSQLSLIAVAAALINLVFSLLMIPRWGMMGAAGSTLLAFGFMALATTYLAQSAYPVRYEYARLTKLIAVSATLYLIADQTGSRGLWFDLVYHAVLLAIVLPLALFAVGVVDDRERALVRNWLRRDDPLPS